jgi:two-component system chemotaxis response regulator CheB
MQAPAMGSPIRVLVVDDSALVRQILTRALSEDPDIEIVGTARDGVEALQKAAELKPDVITLDIEMPELDGIGVLRHLSKHSDARVVVLSSVDDEGTTYLALSLGAIEFVQKPTAGIATSIADLAADMRAKIRTAFNVTPAHAHALAREGSRALRATRRGAPAASPEATSARPEVVVGLAASTGGPPALERVVSGLPPSPGVAFVIVQHLPAGFSASFARRLSTHSAVEFVEAEQNAPLLAGRGYVAPHGSHLTIVAGESGIHRCHLSQDPPIHGVRPSADPLFESLAAQFGESSVAVVLTGMGTDGATGAAAVKRAGGAVIVQDEATSVVWGMPGATLRAGAVTRGYPVGDIAGRIVRAIQIRSEEASA